MTIKVLDSGTIRSIHSGQVISDLESIVKELLEQVSFFLFLLVKDLVNDLFLPTFRNSLDAHATSIELVFTNNGLESLQVSLQPSFIELTRKKLTL